MYESRHFLNLELIEEVKRVGLENCFIVTNGEREFNTDKLQYSGIWDLFGGEKRIRIVPGDKTEAIQKICAENPDTDIIFVDNRIDFLKGLEGIPRLKTILYDENGLEKFKREIGLNSASELKRK